MSFLFFPFSITIFEGDISQFTVDGLRLSKKGTNYVLRVTAQVQPADLHVFMKTEGMFKFH